MIRFLLFFLLLALSSNLVSQDLVPHFRKIEGLPFAKQMINCIEIEDGEQVWVGTDKGLLRIQGTQVEYTKISQKSSQYLVRSLSIDDEGNKWLGSMNNVILRLDSNGRFNEIVYQGDESQDEGQVVLDVLSTGNKVWWSTSKGSIISYDQKKKTFYQVPSSYNGRVHALFGSKGELELVGRQNGLFENTGNYKDWKEFKNISKVYKILKHNKTHWAIGFDRFRNPLLISSKNLKDWENHRLDCMGTNNVGLNDFDIDSQGKVWIGINQGFIKYDPDTKKCQFFTYHKYKDEFDLRTVTSIAVQNDSVIWAGSVEGGLYEITLRKEKVEEEEVVLEILEEVAAVEETEVEDEPETPSPPSPPKTTQKKSLTSFEDIKCDETLELSELLFVANTNRWKDRRLAEEYLDILVLYLTKYEDQNIELYGHTDNLSNNEAYLFDLSEKRVRRVKEYLTENGIKSKRIQTIAYGGTKPIIKSGVTVGREKNRRVEVHIKCD